MTSQVRYDEAVLAPRWMMWVGLGIAVLSGVAATSALRDASLATSERALTAAAIALSGLVVGLVALVFSRLRVHAGPEGVRAAFGPFAKTIEPSSIAGVRAEHYRWLRFGGWGVRLSWNLRDRAYSVPFVPEGVTILLQGGRTVFFSSRQPERLAAAIAALAGRPSGARAL
jgi:hypothetical protein